MTSKSLNTSLLQALVGDQEVETLFSDRCELNSLLEAEAALAEAGAEAGLIENAAARRIVDVCGNFQPDWDSLRRGLAQDGVVVPELIKQLRSEVGEPYTTAVHKGATSQDIIDTALMIRLNAATAIFSRRLEAHIDNLEAVRARDGAVVIAAHTRMQVALPFTVNDKIATWIAPLRRHHHILRTRLPELMAVQLGGPIGTRREFEGRGDAVAASMAKRLGLVDAAPWHSQRDRIGEIAAWFANLSGTLGKIGQDIALLAQNEVGALQLSRGGGSSAMPHKSNPVAAEILVALARFNAGLLGTLHQALVHENERSGAAWTLEWMTLPQVVVTAASGLAHAQTLVDSMRFSPVDENR